jgi:hypothetical protein
MKIYGAHQAFYKTCMVILTSCMYSTLSHALDLSYLSKNEFILINKTGSDIYYSIKDAFIPGKSGEAALPQVTDFQRASNTLGDNNLKAIGSLPKNNDSIFILLVSTDQLGEAPLGVYYFQNQSQKRRVFLEVIIPLNSKNWDTVKVNPLPNKKATKMFDGKTCIDLWGTKSYADEDVIPSKDAKGNDADPGVCLDLTNNILAKDLVSHDDIAGDSRTPADQAKFKAWAHKMGWIK